MGLDRSMSSILRLDVGGRARGPSQGRGWRGDVAQLGVAGAGRRSAQQCDQGGDTRDQAGEEGERRVAGDERDPQVGRDFLRERARPSPSLFANEKVA